MKNFAILSEGIVFDVDAGFVAGSGDKEPTLIDRGIGGQVVGFDYLPKDPEGPAPGESSSIMVIRTNATDFRFKGFTLVIDGGAVEINTNEPTVAPEPGTLAPALMGVPVAFIAWRRRQITQS